MRPEFGRVVRPGELRAALDEMIASPERRRKAGDAARAWAGEQRFAETARRLAEWIG
jgi:UDP:flavonoid glycosyltransferase YjiC (YdhE family)